MYADKTLSCSQCNESFTFTAGEQEFYSGAGFGEGPSRCPECRGVQGSNHPGTDGGAFALEAAEANKEQLFAAECVRCGGAARVPARMLFGDGTIYCSDCIANEYGDRPVPPDGFRGSW